MPLLDFFRKRAGRQRPANERFSRHWTPDGIELWLPNELREATPEALSDQSDDATPDETVLVAYLVQLAQAGRLQLDGTRVLLSWHDYFDLRADPEHSDSVAAFDLPAQRELRPVLGGEATLADQDFSVHIEAWYAPAQEEEFDADSTIGAVIRIDGIEALLPEAAWRLVEAVDRFNRRPGRSQHDNELGWGHVRAMADAAGAFYRTPYLQTTYVLTPQTLRLPLRREETTFGRVLTVEPTFDGAPQGWIKAFDGFNSAQPHYDLVSPDGGHVRVVLSEPVRKVLEVIKREMPARKVAGARAQQFLHNPWAFVGDEACDVIKEEDFARDRAGAGALECRFAVVPRIQKGRIERVDLTLQEHFADGYVSTTSEPLKGPDELDKFLNSLSNALASGNMKLAWKEFDLDLDGEASRQLEMGHQVLQTWRSQPAETITFEDVYELAGYSSRVEGIGVAKPVYVPVLQKPPQESVEQDGWLPKDATPMVRVTLEGTEDQVLIPVTKEWVDAFDKKVTQAEQEARQEVTDEVLPTPVATQQARVLADSFQAMLGLTEKVRADRKEDERGEKRKRQPGEALLVKTNLLGVDYREERRLRLLLPDDARARLPRSLRPGIKLKQHQLNGVAWFQHLVSRAPVDCRGALLADDMGLGKTIQLLSVLGRYYEENLNAAPSLVVAPKSLVDNWAGEVKKFFDRSYAEVLVLYDEELRKRKQPLGLIDQRLRDRGVVELLRPDWAGQAKVVITTYEVLKSYEFSLARQPFAFVICDEAQRIKTPGTQVSLAVRALKADFRIACTGTPVENSLTDLWCLFDFVQPGLLGALEEFSRTYRRPIECVTDDQRSALERLQQEISPQTLRRTKLDIAHELPKKYFAVSGSGSGAIDFREHLGPSDQLEVPMSAHQLVLYKGGLQKLQQASGEQDSRKRARLSFGALHLIKAVCAEPYCLPGMKFKSDSLGEDKHLENSPKLAWLLNQLERVRTAGEKAIVFTELREVQAAIFYFLKRRFGLKPHIINGDTQSRQRYIDSFSESEGFDVIILSTLAAGAGLNVTAANHVFHYTRAWNPAKENQATDRAYRIGQERPVYVYCPTAVAPDFPTFDVRLDQIMRRKAALSDATIGGSSMESMLNGSGRDVSISELLADGGAGAGEAPTRYLTMDDVDRMDGTRFEVLCAMLWASKGFASRVTSKRGGDGGVDVVAIKGGEGELLQCKSSVNDAVGWDAIKEVVTGAARYQAQMPKVRLRRLAVTNQSFNSTARAHAELNRVRLVERAEIEELVARYPIDFVQFEDEVMEVVMAMDAA